MIERLNYLNIIVEGPDCSGKSTLVNQLKNELHWDSKSLHHKPGKQFQRYLREYALAEELVLDRSHISEVVYSELWRGGNSFLNNEVEILDNLVQINSIIIFACPPLELMQERYLLRDYDQQITFDELKTSRDLFYQKLSGLPHRVYLSENYEELNKLVLDVRSKIIQ